MKRWIRLMGFEFRKLFGSRVVLLMTAALMAVNGWQIYRVYQDNCVLLREDSYPQVYEEMYDGFSGEITAEKISQLLAIYQPLRERILSMLGYPAEDPDSYTGNAGTDEFFFSRYFVNEMQYDYLYQNHVYEIVRNAQANMDFYEAKGNHYEYRKNARIVEDFQERKIETFTYTEMFHQYLSYDFSVIPVLMICLFGMSGVFVIEKETEMTMLLTTTRNGGMRTAAAKLTASFLFCCLICGLFWLEDFGLFSACFRSGEAAKSPLYALPYFQNTPLRLSIGQFSLVLALVKTLGVWGCCSFYLLLSSLFRSVMIPFIGGICLTVLLFFRQIRSLSNVALKCWNPIELVCGRDLFSQTRYVNVLGQPVRMYWPVIGSAAVAAVILCGLVMWLNRGRRRGGR